MRYATFRLPLPSGGVVRARKLDRIALLSHGLLCFPLLAEAAEVSRQEDDEPKRADTNSHVAKLCRAALVDADVSVDDLSMTDRMALCSWASAPGVVAPAEPDEDREWAAADFIGLVRSESALTLDALCRRYQAKPSELCAVTDVEIAAELDLAIAYRGLVNEGKIRKGENEVEVEDAFGRKLKVPAAWMQPNPDASLPGAKVTHVDDYARRMAKMGLTELGFTAGGGDGTFGQMNGMRQ